MKRWLCIIFTGLGAILSAAPAMAEGARAEPAHARAVGASFDGALVRARLALARTPALKFRPAPPRTPPAGYLDDPTLRRNDIVVTREGYFMFMGSGAGPHDAADFVPLDPAAAQRRFTGDLRRDGAP